MSRTPLLLSLLAFALVPLQADEPALDLRGRIERKTSQSFQLPAERKGMWHISLEGDTDGVDLDLTARNGEERWRSRGKKASEQLFVPSRRPVEVVVEHYRGGASGFGLVATHVSPDSKLRGGKEQSGALDATGDAFALHELTGSRKRYFELQLDAAAPAEDLDLDLYLVDESFRTIASSKGRTARERVIAAPTEDSGDRWVIVRAFRGAAEYTLTAGEASKDAPELEPDQTLEARVEVGGASYFSVKTSRPGIVIVSLDGPDNADLDLTVYGPDGYLRDSTAKDSIEEVAINGARRGEYLVQVHPGAATASGDFRVSLEELSIKRLATNGVGGTRLWGLFVGVATYEEVSDLSYTCGDALAMYGELCRRGEADSRHSIVLLDELATRANIGEALDEIARRADDDDIFLFFYSGHGGNGIEDGARGDEADERDGQDEYLVCYDSKSGTHRGDLIDDDLSTYLDAIRAERQILMFDACFAGGFEEVIDRDGRYGLFSSLETQVSNEAVSLKAGLLTAVLMDAMRGDADGDGNGGVSLQELTRYVHDVVPNTCPGCQGPLPQEDRRCRSCGRDGDSRQIPVVNDRIQETVELTWPGAEKEE